MHKNIFKNFKETTSNTKIKFSEQLPKRTNENLFNKYSKISDTNKSTKTNNECDIHSNYLSATKETHEIPSEYYPNRM